MVRPFWAAHTICIKTLAAGQLLRGVHVAFWKPWLRQVTTSVSR
jgi:hypothetical protein